MLSSHLLLPPSDDTLFAQMAMQFRLDSFDLLEKPDTNITFAVKCSHAYSRRDIWTAENSRSIYEFQEKFVIILLSSDNFTQL